MQWRASLISEYNLVGVRFSFQSLYSLILAFNLLGVTTLSSGVSFMALIA